MARRRRIGRQGSGAVGCPAVPVRRRTASGIGLWSEGFPRGAVPCPDIPTRRRAPDSAGVFSEVKMYVEVQAKRLPHGEGLPLPGYANPWDAGMDLAAAIAADRTLVVGVGECRPVPTGFAFAIPFGFFGCVRPRSGLARKRWVTVMNSPGTIDAGYRGEVEVLVVNHGTEAFHIKRGDRIAQLVVLPVATGVLREVAELPESVRGDAGFGSTGA